VLAPTAHFQAVLNQLGLIAGDGENFGFFASPAEPSLQRSTDENAAGRFYACNSRVVPQITMHGAARLRQ
jgi:hypothetical protein